MVSGISEPGPTRIAVFGSVATDLYDEPPIARPVRFLSPNAAAVLERALELIAAKSPAIATPILDRAVAAGKISSAERLELLDELVGAPGAAIGPRTAAVRRLRREVSAAIARAAPGLARPLLDEAVASERLTAAQELRILERLRESAGFPGAEELRAVSSFA
jgi:hypothetical protein